jgi:hypothetical protein
MNSRIVVTQQPEDAAREVDAGAGFPAELRIARPDDTPPR